MVGQASQRMEFGRRHDHPVVTIRRAGRERHFVVRPWLVVGGSLVIAALSVLHLGATAYMVFHDDVLSAAVSHQVRSEQAYEDRIAALRLRVDRINSRQLLDQEGLEAKVEDLIERHKSIADRSSALQSLMDRARKLGLKLPEASAPAAETKPAAPKTASNWFTPFAPTRPRDDLSSLVATIETDLNQYRADQIDTVTRVAARDADRIEKTVGKLGVRLDQGGVGGPLVLPAPGAEFDHSLRQAESELDRLGRLRTALHLLPLRKPLGGDMVMTSPFGSRTDPFLGVGAIHTGADYRGDSGDQVYATGPGRITEASRQGGYGLMVEIDHGDGITTRYGHLSRINVSVGDKVRPGDIVGFVGSTGRSTGPHLHYETRIAGEAVDPTNWLEAGDVLRTYLR